MDSGWPCRSLLWCSLWHWKESKKESVREPFRWTSRLWGQTNWGTMLPLRFMTESTIDTLTQITLSPGTLYLWTIVILSKKQYLFWETKRIQTKKRLSKSSLRFRTGWWLSWTSYKSKTPFQTAMLEKESWLYVTHERFELPISAFVALRSIQLN